MNHARYGRASRRGRSFSAGNAQPGGISTNSMGNSWRPPVLAAAAFHRPIKVQRNQLLQTGSKLIVIRNAARILAITAQRPQET